MSGQSATLSLKEAKAMQDSASISTSSNPKNSGGSGSDLMRKETHQDMGSKNRTMDEC